MLSSTRGNSFGISKKILCVIMTISLSLMMLPSALFRSEAQAASPTNDDVFVKADSDMTNFGQFAFNPNSNAANISTYTQNDLLHAIGCKAETEASLQDQVANEVKAFLVKNQFSLVDDVFPAVKEGYTIKGTSIVNVTSQLPSLTATYDKTKGTAKFVTTAPASSLDTGVVIITAEYAKLVAEYDAVFSNLTTDLAQAQELVINTKTCEGKVTITPTANKDANGKTVYKLNVDTAIKNINTLTNKYNVSVSLLNENNEGNNPGVNVVNGEVTVDLSSIVGSQDMREVTDMKDRLVYVVNHSSGINVPDEEGNDTTVYLGVVDTYKDSILDSNAYTVKNEAINNITINTKTGLFDIFKLFTDDQRTLLDTTDTLVINNPKFNINKPANLTDISNNIGFYDEDDVDHEFIPSSDLFPGDYVTAMGKNSITLAKASDSQISFATSCRACDRPGSGTTSTAKLFVKTTSDNNVIKYAEQTCSFVSESGYKGYTVEAVSPGTGIQVIDDMLSFFFASDKVKINFKFDSVAATNYAQINVSSGSRGKSPIFSCNTPTTSGNEKVFSVEFGNAEEANSATQDLKDKYIVAFNSRGGRACYPKVDLVATSPKTIIANAPQPASVAISWEGGSEPAEYGTADVKFTLSVTMPEGEGDIFKYTKAAKSTDTLAKLQDEVNGEANDFTPILTYNDLTQSGNTWSASAEIKAENNTEHKFILTIPAVKDILGRPAKDGVTTEYSKTFSIDKKNPDLTVVWNPEQPSSEYGNYFNQPRTAELSIDEMNFDSSKIKIHQIYTDDNGNKTEKDLTGLVWEKNGYIHKTSFVCNLEGDYEFKITGKDNAGNVMKYGEADEYTTSFTTDWTIPDINVVFDNNAAVNGMYYTSGRTATISVGEHNFSEDLMNVDAQVIPGNDGTMGTYQKSGWSHTGNIHTMTVAFTSEGTYSLTVSGEDLAGNPGITKSAGQFVIDWTKPTITISGVENRQAYGDTAQPNVTINDANMSSATTCQVESLGATKGHPYSTSPSASPAVYTYSYANPERVPENDGVYRINVNAVDMAGNGEVQERVWSVNRFGSTYVIDAETEKMMDGYVNKDSIKDVIVTEINPSGVENHSIDMTKGSFTETLKEGSDYTVAASGGDGTWYECIYTISKNFFKEDGKYTLNYISKDKAGNENENTMANKNADRNAAVNVQFMYDNAKPTVSFDNLSESLYAEASHKATANFEDNSKKFSEAKVIINGEENYVSGDDMDKKHNAIDFELKDSGTPYTIEAIAIDKAGNEMDKDVKTVVVTMNPFLLWFYNTPLFVGSLVGAGAIVAGVLFFLYRRGLWIFKK